MRSRQLEWERKRVTELQAHQQQVQDQVRNAQPILCERKISQVVQVRQKQKNMSFQQQALDEKQGEVEEQISGLREQIKEVTSEIEAMKSMRDEKLALIDAVKKAIIDAQQRLNEAAAKKAQAVQERRTAMAGNAASQQYEAVKHQVAESRASAERMRQEIEHINAEVQRKREMTDSSLDRLASLKTTIGSELQANKDVYERLLKVQQQAQEQLDAYQPSAPPHHGDAFAASGGGDQFNDPFGTGTTAAASGAAADGFDNSAWGASESSGRDKATAGGATARYRALYEFQARNDDELDFQPGDVIIVFKVAFDFSFYFTIFFISQDHTSEPGWLAGQIRDKVGWFPEAYAECIDDAQQANAAAPQQVTSPTNSGGIAQQKLPSIHEEMNEAPAAQPIVCYYEEHDKKTRNVQAEDTSQHTYHMAIYPFAAAEEGDLAFEMNDIITVISKEDDWWRGRIDGR